VDLPANATVALQSLTCVPSRDTLTVGGCNDDIVYQLTQAGGELRCSLDAARYNAGNNAALLDNIERRMNSVLSPRSEPKLAPSGR